MFGIKVNPPPQEKKERKKKKDVIRNNYIGLMALRVCLKCNGAKEEFLCLARWSISSISAFSSSSLTGSIRDNDRLKRKKKMI